MFLTMLSATLPRWHHLGSRLSPNLHWNDRACQVLNWAVCQHPAEQIGFYRTFLLCFFCIFFFPSHRGQNSRFSVQGRSLARWGSVAARCRSKLCSAQLGHRLALVPRALSFHAEVNFFVKKIIITIALIILIIIIITIVNHQHLILFSACQHKWGHPMDPG